MCRYVRWLILCFCSLPIAADAEVFITNATHKIAPKNRQLRCLSSPRICYNGGYLAQKNCICPPFTTGYCCEQIQCQNHGIPDGQSCKCPPGWYSQFCEKRGSRPRLQADFDLEKRSFVLIINYVETMYSVREMVITYINTTLAQMDVLQPDLISNYVYVLFYDSGVTGGYGTSTYTATSTSRSDFLSSLDATMTSPNPYSPTQGVLRTLSSVLDVIWSDGSQYIRPKSTILLFTDRADRDGGSASTSINDGSIEHQLIEQTLIWGHRPIIYFMETSAPPVDMTSDGYMVYKRYVTATNGELIRTSSDRTEFQWTMATIPYLMKNELLLSFSFTTATSLSFTNKLLIESMDLVQYMLITIDDNSNSSFPIELLEAGADGPSTVLCQGKKWVLRQLNNYMTEFITAPNGTSYSLKTFLQSDISLLYSISGAPHADSDGIINYQAVSRYLVAEKFPQDQNSVTSISVEALDSTTGNATQQYMVGDPTKNDNTFSISFGNPNQLCVPGPYLYKFNMQLANNGTVARLIPGYCSTVNYDTARNENVETSELIDDDIVGGFGPPPCYIRDFTGYNQPRFHNYEQIFFVVEVSLQMNGSLQALMDLIPEVVTQTAQYNAEGIPQYFTLLTFDDTKISTVVSDYSPKAFVRSLESALSPTALHVNAANSALVVDAVLEALKLKIVSPAQINVFTTSQSAASSGNMVLPRDVQVNFFSITDLMDTDYSKIILQKQSAGRFLSLPSSTIPNLNSLLTQSIAENALLWDSGAQNCRNGANFTVFADNSISTLTFTIKGEGAQMMMATDGSGNALSTNVIFAAPNSVVYAASWSGNRNNTQILFSVFTPSDSPCFAQIHAVATFNLAVGFQENQASDTVVTLPYSRRGTNTTTYTAVQFTSTDFNFVTMFMTAISASMPWNASQPTYVDLLQRSENCTYQYISNTVLMPQADFIEVIVQGFFSNQSLFERTFYYYTPTDDKTCSTYDSFGQCVCDQNHSGERCSIPICQNLGTPSKDVCICLLPCYGDFCQYGCYYPGNSSMTSTVSTTVATTTTKGVDKSLISAFIVMVLISMAF